MQGWEMTRVERLATAVAVVTRVVVTTSTKQDRLESGWEMSALACYSKRRENELQCWGSAR